MAPSPFRPPLYRSVLSAVICTCLSLSLAQFAGAQLARKTKQKGPRALALVELSPSGKARLIPIAIMVGDKFYDASAYKASPVPMALWSETVYEGERSGVSQGLFTVGGAARVGDAWFAEGKWQPAGSAPSKPRPVDKKPVLDEDEGPPKLRRREPETGQSSPVPASPASSPSTPPQTPTTAATTTAPASAAPAPPSDQSPDQSATVITAANDTDPNRPVLRRGKTETPGTSERTAAPAAAKKASAAAPAKTADKRGAMQLIAAISDADGPEPRPYSYDLHSDEEQKYRKQMLAQASAALQKYIQETTPALAGPRTPRPPAPKTPERAAKPLQPNFEDVEFRTFDLWNTNEPVFVLTAKAHPARTSGDAASTADLTYFITLVAKADIYGDLRTLRASVTDTHHLDEFSRLELIDAIDADGDGRGELLFREVSDAGSAWGVYRAGADQLFPLFQGTPSGRSPVAP